LLKDVVVAEIVIYFPSGKRTPPTKIFAPQVVHITDGFIEVLDLFAKLPLERDKLVLGAEPAQESHAGRVLRLGDPEAPKLGGDGTHSRQHDVPLLPTRGLADGDDAHLAEGVQSRGQLGVSLPFNRLRKGTSRDVIDLRRDEHPSGSRARVGRRSIDESSTSNQFPGNGRS